MDKSNAQKTFGTLAGKKILVVDDEKMNQLVIQNMIKLWGAESEIAEDGSDALQKIHKDNYDIILMDLMMPGLNGYQTAEKIRKEENEKINSIPILALTGSSANASYEKIKESGISDFAAKPFKIEELHAKISNLLFGKNDGEEISISQTSSIINLEYLRETTVDNPKLIKEIINIFLEQTPGFLAKLDEAVSSQNWTEVKTVAHKMKPTVSYVGIISIENIIKDIEDFSDQRIKLDKIPSLLFELKNVCELAFVELKKELERITE